MAACHAAGVSTSAYDTWRRQLQAGPTRAQQHEAELVGAISAAPHESGATYGAPRVHAQLRSHGHVVNHKWVARLMRIHGLVGIHPGPGSF